MDETETDIEVLLECLKCQRNDPMGLKRSLLALSSVLGSNGRAKEHIRETRGLHDVHSLLFKDLPADVQQAAMYCLACAIENDVFSQSAVTNIETFSYIHHCLSSKKANRKLTQTAAYLLMCLVTHNSLGQNLARTSSCLSDALLLFQRCSEMDGSSSHLHKDILDLWSSLIAALNGCVNNPQNEANQRLCCTVLPLCFKIVCEEGHQELNVSLLSFVRLTVAGNAFNQDRVKMSGGLDMLLKHLKNNIDRAKLGSIYEHHVLSVSGAISSCIMESEQNIHYFLERGGLHLFLSLLKSLDVTSDGILETVVTIGRVLEFAEKSSSVLITEEEGRLIALLTETENEEVVHAIKYILSFCHKHGNSNVHSALHVEEVQTNIRSKVDELLAALGNIEDKKLYDSEHLCLKSGKSTEPEKRHPVSCERGESDVGAAQCVEREWALFQYFKKFLSQVKSYSLLDQKADDAGHTSVTLERTGGRWCKYAESLTTMPPADRSCPTKSGLTQRQGPCQLMQNGEMVTLFGTRQKESVDSRQEQEGWSVKIPLPADVRKPDFSYGSKEPRPIKPQCSRGPFTEEDKLSDSRSGKNPNCGCSYNPDGSAFCGDMQRVAADLSCGHNHCDGVSYTMGTTNICADLSKEKVSFKKPRNCHSIVTDVNTTADSVLCGECLHQNLTDDLTVKESDTRFDKSDELKVQNKEVGVVPGRNRGHPSCGTTNTIRKPALDAHVGCVGADVEKCLHLGHERPSCGEESAACKSCFHCKNLQHTGREQQEGQQPVKTCSSSQEPKANESRKVRGEKFLKAGSLFLSMGNQTKYPTSCDCCTYAHGCLAEISPSRKDDGMKGVKNTWCPYSTCALESEMRCSPASQKKGKTSHRALSRSPSAESQHKDTDVTDKNVFMEQKGSCISKNIDAYRPHKTSERERNLPINKRSTTLSRQGAGGSLCHSAASSSPQSRCKLQSQIQQAGMDTNEDQTCLVTEGKVDSGRQSKFRVPHPVDVAGGGSSVRRNFTGTEYKTAGTAAQVLRRRPVVTLKHFKTPAPSPTWSEFDVMLLRTAAGTHKAGSDKVGRKTRPRSVVDLKSLATRCWPQITGTGNVGQDLYSRQQQPVMKTSGCQKLDESGAKTDNAKAEISDLSTTVSTSSLDSLNARFPIASSEEGADGVQGAENTVNMVDTSDSSSETYSILDDASGKLQAAQHAHGRPATQCPGCSSSKDLLTLNSRTFNIVIETNSYTCKAHRMVRQIERDFILERVVRATPQSKLPYRIWREKQTKCKMFPNLTGDHQDLVVQSHSGGNSPSIYSFYSSDSDDRQRNMVSPPHLDSPRSSVNTKVRSNCYPTNRCQRRQRVPYSEEEVKWLVQGVQKLGRRWQQIRYAYPFHPSRTSVDLKEKYKRIKCNRWPTADSTMVSHSKTGRLPLSMCEVRRLQRGVATKGLNWTTILHSERFAPGRTAKELQEKWRAMIRKKQKLYCQHNVSR